MSSFACDEVVRPARYDSSSPASKRTARLSIASSAAVPPSPQPAVAPGVPLQVNGHRASRESLFTKTQFQKNAPYATWYRTDSGSPLGGRANSAPWYSGMSNVSCGDWEAQAAAIAKRTTRTVGLHTSFPKAVGLQSRPHPVVDAVEIDGCAGLHHEIMARRNSSVKPTGCQCVWDRWQARSNESRDTRGRCDDDPRRGTGPSSIRR